MAIYERVFVFWIFIYTCRLTEGIAYVGCYLDSSGKRVLATELEDHEYTNTPEECARRCSVYRYAGVEYWKKCFCGDTITAEAEVMPASECSYRCPGDDKKMCGGFWRISVYTTRDETCQYNGVTYQGGQIFKDDCNDCNCSDEAVECTDRDCPKTEITSKVTKTSVITTNSFNHEGSTMDSYTSKRPSPNSTSSDERIPGGTTHPSIHAASSIPASSTTTTLDGSTAINFNSKVPSTKESTDTLGIGIGVAVGLLCAVGAIVVIIVLRRRGALTCKYGTHTDTSDTTKVDSFAVASRSYEDTVENHNYFILEKRAQSVEDTVDHYYTADEPNADNDETNNYNSIDEDPYHSVKDDNGDYDYTTNAASTGPNSIKPDNVYNKLKMDRPGDYDHVGRLEHKVTIEGIDYNTTALAHMNDDISEYNHIPQPGSTTFARGNGPRDLAQVDYDVINGQVKLPSSDAADLAHVKV